ncbi:hypothetical protein [Flavobacterium sp.]|jgi:hypothetical protein|uniref:hypothetical protein n=1 Tax=Flavobacterium sp. TaxID=239 RepID=UPI00262D34BB|nr:hypothetical protein [Flavobacterium sp.]
MEEIEKLLLERHPLIEKLLREGIIKVQEEYSDSEELLPELKASIIDGGLFNRKSIQHPLVIGDIGMMPNSYYNNQLMRKKERLKEFENNKEFESYLFLIEKPFRVTFFSDLVKQHKIKKLSKKYWKILSSLWTGSENIFQNKELWDDLLKDKSNSHYFMSKKDLKFFNSLENEFIVYRGYSHWENGYSYTLDKERAIWFADRFGQNGFVKERLVRKEEVFAYTNSREENEIIILK